MNEHHPTSPIHDDKPAGAKVIPTMDLVTGAWNRYTSMFVLVFPILVIAFISSAILSLSTLTPNGLASGLLSIVGFVCLILSYLALGRQLTAAEADPADVTGSLRRTFSLFFPYLWIAILSCLNVSLL